jgi:hypothetical protein
VATCVVCLENNITSQGKTIDEAMANLREAIVLFGFPRPGRYTERKLET